MMMMMILVLCVILCFFYPLHLYVFVLICQYYVVLLERTNKDIIYYIYITYYEIYAYVTMFIQQFASKFDRWRACEQHRDNTANKLLLTTVDMDCIEYWNLYSN